MENQKKIKRIDFLPASPAGGPDNVKDLAEINEALAIGYGQTISQPEVVAFMLKLLKPKLGNKILDVGSGSGWTTALLANIVGEKGRVVAIELIPELMEFGKKNVAQYIFIKKGIVEFICADGSKGYKKEAPYDRILVSAAVQEEIPKAWKEQLKIGGRLVAPVGNSIWLLIKKSKNDFERIEYPGFIFVPLIEKR
ncbi:MAG: protein-L-isoaspartate O-methyltransferase [bacterium]